MLKNSIVTAKNGDVILCSESNDNRLLPFSVLFDLLRFLNNQKLSLEVQAVFSDFLPKMRDYQNEIDLWVDLESCGEITALMAAKFAELIVKHLDVVKRIIHFDIHLVSNLTRDNQLFIHFLQSSLDQIKITYRDSGFRKFKWLSAYDFAYFSWFDFQVKEDFSYDNEVASVLRYAWRCAELGAEEVGFRLLEKGYSQTAYSCLKQLYLTQLQFMRVATQHYQLAANDTRTRNALNDPSPQMTYIKSINLAHLFKSKKNYQEALNQYELAFSTLDGIKTESDFMDTNMNYGIVYERKGDFDRALKYWLKAAIHWIVMKTPYALSRRAIHAIALQPRAYVDVDEISNGFVIKLKNLTKKANRLLKFDINHTIQMSLYSHEIDLNNANAFGTDGISIIAKKSVNLPAVDASDIKVKLTQLAVGLLASFLGFCPNQYNTFVVDRMDGIDLPTDLNALVRSCLLLSISEFKFNKQIIVIKKEWMSKLAISISSSILEIHYSHQAYVKHKRYYPKNKINLDEIKLLRVLQSENEIYPFLDTYTISVDTILALMDRKLISVRLELNDDCYIIF